MMRPEAILPAPLRAFTTALGPLVACAALATRRGVPALGASESIRKRFLRDPLGREIAQKLHFSEN